MKTPKYITFKGKLSHEELEKNFDEAIKSPLEPDLIELCKRLGDK